MPQALPETLLLPLPKDTHIIHIIIVIIIRREQRESAQVTLASTQPYYMNGYITKSMKEPREKYERERYGHFYHKRHAMIESASLFMSDADIRPYAHT